MKTNEEIEVLLSDLEVCIQQGHPYMTSNTPRKELKEVVELVRELQAENEALKQEKVAA